MFSNGKNENVVTGITIIKEISLGSVEKSNQPILLFNMIVVKEFNNNQLKLLDVVKNHSLKFSDGSLNNLPPYILYYLKS